MANPQVFGPAYSTFTRTVRLALEEKGQAYDLIEVDILHGAHQRPEHLARHPFGKVPAFRHGDLQLFETDPITRYVNEAFAGPDLEPPDPRRRALMGQAIAVIAGYAYPAIVGQIFMQRVVAPMVGGTADETVIQDAVPKAETCIRVLEQMAQGHACLVSEGLSRADLFLIPIYDYLVQTPEGQQLVAGAPNIQRWWQNVRTRPAVEATRPQLG